MPAHPSTGARAAPGNLPTPPVKLGHYQVQTLHGAAPAFGYRLRPVAAPPPTTSRRSKGLFRRKLISALASLAALTAGLAGAAPEGPPAPPAQTPVTETLWGVTLRDPYRGLERLDPPTLDWI